MRFRYVFLLCPLICALSQAAAAQTPDRLALTDALRQAREHSPLLRGAGARLTGAAARLRSAGLLANPILLLGPHVGDNTGGLDEDILITQTVELGDKRRQKVYSARAERDAAMAQKAQALLDLDYMVRAAYYDALLALVIRQQAQDALTNAQAFATAAEQQFQAGDVPRSNVVRSRVEVSRARDALNTAETDRANRFDTLRSLIGAPDSTELTLTDSLAFAPITVSLADLQLSAMRNRPDVKASLRLRDARSADLHAARAASQPDLILEGRHRTFSPTDEGSSLRFGIQFPLIDYGRSRAEARAAQSALAEQDAAYAEALRTAQLDVRTSFRNLEQARHAVEAFNTGRLKDAGELLSMAQLGYQRGANSFLELLDAQQVYRSEQVEYARALAAYNTARAALDRAAGGSLR